MIKQHEDHFHNGRNQKARGGVIGNAAVMIYGHGPMCRIMGVKIYTFTNLLNYFSKRKC
jgi:hypothetical protein